MERRRTPTRREGFTRTFVSSGEVDAYTQDMGDRVAVTGMSFGSDSIKVSFRYRAFEEVMPKPMPRAEQPTTTGTKFNMDGSITFEPGSFGTK